MKSLFYVNGKPFFSIGGQVNNSSTHSRKTLEKALRAIELFEMNTIAVPIYWYQIEPEEGNFDFEQIEFVLEEARKRSLKVVFLWFGSWKNGASHYVPSWVKKDKMRFKWALNQVGARTRILSPLCNEAKMADINAFTHVMKYIKEVNEDDTVIAVQVENEPGLLGTPRDYSPSANEIFNDTIPEDMIRFLEKNPNGEIYDCWMQNGSCAGDTWKNSFGFMAEEIFSAYFFSKYIEDVAAAGKSVYKLPMYVNVWVRETMNRIAGIDYPSGGATSPVLDLWKHFAPSIECICPDIYFSDLDTYDLVCSKYKRDDNILYIPESRAGDLNALHLFRMIEKYELTGIHCFAIDSTIDNEGNLRRECEDFRNAVKILSSMKPLLEKYQGTGAIYSVVQYEGMDSQFFDFGDFYGRVYFLNSITDEPYIHLDSYHNDDCHRSVRGKGLIVYAGDGEFYLAGDGFKLVLIKKDNIDIMASSLRAFKYLNARNHEFISVEEGTFNEEGSFEVNKVRCGDESDMGLWVYHDIGLVRAVFDIE